MTTATCMCDVPWIGFCVFFVGTMWSYPNPIESYHRTRTGVGQKIDCSLMETQLACLANIGQNWLVGACDEARRWWVMMQYLYYQPTSCGGGWLSYRSLYYNILFLWLHHYFDVVGYMYVYTAGGLRTRALSLTRRSIVKMGCTSWVQGITDRWVVGGVAPWIDDVMSSRWMQF